MSVVLITRAHSCVVLFCVICVFCLFVVLFRLSVPVQVIDRKDSSPKMTYNDVKPYSLTHSLVANDIEDVNYFSHTTL